MKIILLMIALVASSNVSASEIDVASGNALLKNCTEALKGRKEEATINFTDSAHCLSYIAGLSFAIGYWGLNKTCLPPSSTLEQFIRVVYKYLQDHPERLHERRFFLVRDALKEAFPCKKG